MTVMLVETNGLIMFTLVLGLLFIFSVYYAWKNFRQLFVQEPIEIWYYPCEEPAVPSISTENKIAVTVQLPENLTTDQTIYYSVRVPTALSVELLFYYLARVQLKYGLIHDVDVAGTEHGWVFYSLGKTGVRKAVLNPQRSMKKNGIRENGIIEAIRVKANVAYELSQVPLK